MIDFLNHPGFLGTKAILLSDISLVLILLTAILFTIGWRLIRHDHVQAHRWVQTAAAALNAMVVLSVMIYSFYAHILPGLPGKFFEGSYGVTTVHALVGIIGLLLGIFVVLRGNRLVPLRLRFNNYRSFMRTSYALYMVATLLGVVVYVEAFIIGI
jgi:uncharacterized membrane protein YozB (DUF420 family)